MSVDTRLIDRLLEQADVLAGSWSARARASTTPGCERALLRLAGVGGLDGRGRPLAWAVVDRYLAGRADRLPNGVLGPFAAASLEYELPPQDLALEVAAGAIDLGLEAELLSHPERRGEADVEARRWFDAAMDRIDANRIARRELIDLLGDASQPWVGARITEPEAMDAIVEARSLVAAGVDVVRVEVPPTRELADRLHAIGIELEPWRPRHAEGSRETAGDVAPAGSQRGLRRLRGALDEAAAGRRSYVRIETRSSSLATPEQAAVAAFERVDLVEADVVGEILAGVDPDRALADHAFAHRLIGRSGTQLVLGPGQLVVAPELARGIATRPEVLGGRALALQALAIALAGRDGLTPAQVVIGALPDWVGDERDAGPVAIASVALRRWLFPEHLLVFDEPDVSGPAAAAWPFLAAAAMPAGAGTALTMTRASGPDALGRIAAARAAALIARGAAETLGPRELAGPALAYAEGALNAGVELLERLAGDGWRAVLGDGSNGETVRGLGAGAVAERADGFDPFGSETRAALA